MRTAMGSLVKAGLLGAWLMAGIPPARSLTQLADMDVMFAEAERNGRVGLARKVKPVDVRPAKRGEIVITIIKGEGEETRSPPAKKGDMVVRNRCPETGNEEILVAKAKFAERYEGPTGGGPAAPWKEYRPLGKDMLFWRLGPSDGPLTFTAPWGGMMTANAGDVIVRDPKDAKDTYRIAGAAFACTYEVVRAPKAG